MKREMEVKQLTEEFWLVTLSLSEEGKVPYSREFVVSDQQLAFLHVFMANINSGL